MKTNSIKTAMESISELIEKEKVYLGELDAQGGDGDLGVSMSSGFAAVNTYLNDSCESDMGKLLLKCGSVLNNAAPSSLGTIISLGMMGMAKALKGEEECDLHEMAAAMEKGVQTIMEKAKSKSGEKTILDALCPAIDSLKNNVEKGSLIAFGQAAEAAAQGSENTKAMRAIHGRAAYYGDQSIGLLDGGSVVGKLIFKGIYCSICKE